MHHVDKFSSQVFSQAGNPRATLKGLGLIFIKHEYNTRDNNIQMTWIHVTVSTIYVNAKVAFCTQIKYILQTNSNSSFNRPYIKESPINFVIDVSRLSGQRCSWTKIPSRRRRRRRRKTVYWNKYFLYDFEFLQDFKKTQLHGIRKPGWKF